MGHATLDLQCCLGQFLPVPLQNVLNMGQIAQWDFVNAFHTQPAFKHLMLPAILLPDAYGTDCNTILQIMG